MSIHQFYRPIQASAGDLVVALHCSGGSSRQWRALSDRLGPSHVLHAPEMLGARSVGHWGGSHQFSLADEAAPFIQAIDRHDGPIHLVGHSYGGGVALHVAAARPERISSLALYEPSAFHLLKEMGPTGGRALFEVAGVAGQIGEAIAKGAHEEGARLFVDYWNGLGSWSSMRSQVRDEVAAYLPKAALDFEALIKEQTASSEYANFGFPVLVMQGSESPIPTRLIAAFLVSRVAAAVGKTLEKAGHMGPISHAEAVSESFARHIETSALAGRWRAV